MVRLWAAGPRVVRLTILPAVRRGLTVVRALCGRVPGRSTDDSAEARGALTPDYCSFGGQIRRPLVGDGKDQPGPGTCSGRQIKVQTGQPGTNPARRVGRGGERSVVTQY